jgi:aryl-alcohol dehydrogenase-like predicted oxidoreductase
VTEPAVTELSNPARRLGLGLAAVARPAYITSGRAADLGRDRGVVALRSHTWAVLDGAYSAGVRYLDVARSYGRAEEFLAGWLAAHPEVDDVEIGSHEVKDHSLAAYREQIAQTRALLGYRLGVYHVHSATLDSGALDNPELHRAMAELRDSGVRVGISTSGPGQADAVRRALGISVDGAALFTSFQSTWNVLETSVAGALAEAAAAGARVIVKEAVANGRLAPGGQDSSSGSVRAFELAASLGVPVDQLAIAAALAQPWTWRVLSGAVNPLQVASNTAAASLRLPEETLAELATLAEPAAEYWAARSSRAWR